MRQGKTSSACPPSPPSKAQTISTALPSTKLTHWKGHKARLDRDLKGRFGQAAYAAEELVAELGAAFLAAEFSFDGDVRHAGYIAN